VRTACSISCVALEAKFIRRQLRYLPDAEKMQSTAICTPYSSKARFKRSVSKFSGSSTQSMKSSFFRPSMPPLGW
jgi:hypothetical protein